MRLVNAFVAKDVLYVSMVVLHYNFFAFLIACKSPTVENAVLSTNETSVKVSGFIVIKCNQDFYVNGGTENSTSIFCQNSGQFSNSIRGPVISVPKCIRSKKLPNVKCSCSWDAFKNGFVFVNS